MNDQSSGQTSMVPGYGYFMLRLRQVPLADPPGFAGVIERLGSGEKRSFESGDELLRLLGSWSVPLKMSNDAALAQRPFLGSSEG